MKKISLILLFFIIFTFPGSRVWADTFYGYNIPVTISVNGNIIKSEGSGILINGITYVPIRFVCNALNINNVVWDEKEQSVTVTSKEKTLKLFRDKNYGYLNDSLIDVENTVILKRNRILVPIRFLSGIFECDVQWDKTLYLADIENSSVLVPENMIEKNFTKNDIIWLTRLIEAESSGEPFAGKIAVGNVVMNRVESEDFPDRIYDVIFDRQYGVQFQPTANNAIINTPSHDSIIAGNIALRNENIAGESLYFLNPRIATNNWIIRNRIFFKSIYNHDFYL